MNIVFFDDDTWKELHPITLTKPVAEIRIGILKISEKWKMQTHANISFVTEEYLSKKYKNLSSEPAIYINGSLIPDEEIIKVILDLKIGEMLVYKGIVLAFLPAKNLSLDNSVAEYYKIEYSANPLILRKIYDIFQLNGQALERDFRIIIKNKYSQEISATNKLIKPENIFLEEGAKVEYCILNASAGPIYIGKNAEIMEGSIIRGPFALCEGAQVKLGTKIYGPTTVGPECRVGGEVNNSVLQGYSNKGHDGFLGNSVIGEWCNLGADTNNSNLKNNYGNVDIWNYPSNSYQDTGLQFCGLFMGDHSKCGINTMFNTGTVVGVSANIFGAGFPDKFIPSFSWGGPQNPFQKFKLDKAIELAKMVMSRRGIDLSDEDKEILNFLAN